MLKTTNITPYAGIVIFGHNSKTLHCFCKKKFFFSKKKIAFLKFLCYNIGVKNKFTHVQSKI